jgi:hypothetical protein
MVGSFKGLLTNHKARKAQIYTLSDIVQIQVCINRGSRGVGWGKPFLLVSILEIIFKNIPLQNQLANFNQTLYKSPLSKGNSKLYKSRARSFSKGR